MLWISLITMLCAYVQAMSDADLKAEFTKIVMKCMKDHPVEPSELMSLQQLVVPKKKETKCLLACAYKTEGTFDGLKNRLKFAENCPLTPCMFLVDEMNAKGLYDKDHAYKVAELAKEGDEKRLENGKKVADQCAKVNDIEVSDGEKGCDRAALIFKCVVETAPKYGFKV